MDRKEIQSVVEKVLNGYFNTKQNAGSKIPIAVSNRHVHLSREDIDILFGKGYQLKKLKDLSQPGQFAAHECVTLVSQSGVKSNVRILGPARLETQVEISRTDSFELGVKPPVRDSGDLTGSSPIVLVGPNGAVTLRKGVILAWRHIHMPPKEARKLGLSDKQYVKVRASGDRGIVFENVLVRVSSKYALEMHVDTDEANAGLINNSDSVEILL